MKKFLLLVIALFLAGIFTPAKVDAKPLWLKFKLGIFAKWSITTNGECEDGWGLCLAFLPNNSPPANPDFLGYDDETDKFYIKVSKQGASANSFNKSPFEIKEDSPVDPKLIDNLTNFKFKNKKVTIKGGKYPVSDDGTYYIVSPDYYIE